jgi:hypothetical protein
MFDDITNQKKSYGEIGTGIAVAILAVVFLLLFLWLSLGLATNGYFMNVIDLLHAPAAIQNRFARKLASFGLLAFFGFGLTQLIYVVPVIYWARAKGWAEFARGLLIGAAILLLLNVAGALWLSLI